MEKNIFLRLLGPLLKGTDSREGWRLKGTISRDVWQFKGTASRNIWQFKGTASRDGCVLKCLRDDYQFKGMASRWLTPWSDRRRPCPLFTDEIYNSLTVDSCITFLKMFEFKTGNFRYINLIAERWRLGQSLTSGVQCSTLFGKFPTLR